MPLKPGKVSISIRAKSRSDISPHQNIEVNIISPPVSNLNDSNKWNFPQVLSLILAAFTIMPLVARRLGLLRYQTLN